MTQTKDLIKKIADFFTSEEYYEKGEDARLVFSPDDVRCVNRLIQRMSNLDKIKERISLEKLGWEPSAGYYIAIDKVLQIIDKYKAESEE